MKKVFVLALLLVMSVSLNVYAQDENSKEIDVKSTQGIETNAQTAKKVEKMKFNSKPASQRQKIRNKYLKSVNKVEKSKFNKLKKETDLKFYNKRLEIKKQKLEELTSDENEKGEI